MTLRRGPKRSKSDSEAPNDKRSAPRRSQGHLGPAQGGVTPSLPSPPGSHFGTQNVQNKAENDLKSKRKSRSEQKRSKRIKDPSWSDLGRFGGAMWEPEGPKSIGKRTISCTITFSKIRRFEDGFGTNLGRPGRQKERKGPPRGTQDRPQNGSKPTSKST